jgi:hypothetical protein
MQRTTVVLDAPATHDPHHRELAMGMRRVWSCTLFAIGADVFVPCGPLDPDLHPWTAVEEARGVSMTHRGASLGGSADAIVFSELRLDAEGWHLPLRICESGGSELVLPGRAHRGQTSVLDVMVATLDAIATTVDMAIPHPIHWQQLLRVRTVSQGLTELSRLGRRAIRISDPPPPGLRF